jgi:UDP-2,3-diacylglucosamine hydrolase
MFEFLKQLPSAKKVYFISDLHFGAPSDSSSLERERKVCRWLDFVSSDAAAIFFLGDIFDFWFEYKHVIPKGYTRFLGKVVQLRDEGLPIFFFVGNHDLWMGDYFTKELDVPIIRKPVSFVSNEVKIYCGHGDGLGPGDYGYKRLKKVFTNPFINGLFRFLHPDVGIGFANAWSRTSRIHHAKKGYPKNIIPEKEILLSYAKSINQVDPHKYYVFGHRHLPLELSIEEGSTYFNTGEWVTKFTYACFNGEHMQLLRFED